MKSLLRFCTPRACACVRARACVRVCDCVYQHQETYLVRPILRKKDVSFLGLRAIPNNMRIPQTRGSTERDAQGVLPKPLHHSHHQTLATSRSACSHTAGCESRRNLGVGFINNCFAA